MPEPVAFTADGLIEAFGDQAYYKGVRMAMEALEHGDRESSRALAKANIEATTRNRRSRRMPEPTRWRVGSTVPLNVYDGDRPVCQCHKEEDAAMIVSAMNEGMVVKDRHPLLSFIGLSVVLVLTAIGIVCMLLGITSVLTGKG